MTTIDDIKTKYSADGLAERMSIGEKNKKIDAMRAVEKRILVEIKAYVELAQRFQKEYGDSKYLHAAKMRGWLR